MEMYFYSCVYEFYFLGDFGNEGVCSSEDAITIWTGMPACQPRDTIVEVPQLLDPALFQVWYILLQFPHTCFKIG